GLESAIRAAEAARCDAEPAPEGAREVALVDEAGLGRKTRERRVRRDEPCRRPLEPEPPRVAPGTVPEVRAELAREVGRMHTDLPRHGRRGRRRPQELVQKVAGVLEPGLGPASRGPSRAERRELEREALERERRERG